MSEYPQIRHVLGGVFDVMTGLSDEGARAMLLRALESREWRRQFEVELVSAFSKADTDWSTLLFNEKYEVQETDSEEEARKVAASLLWDVTFPGKPLPEIE